MSPHIQPPPQNEALYYRCVCKRTTFISIALKNIFVSLSVPLYVSLSVSESVSEYVSLCLSVSESVYE